MVVPCRRIVTVIGVPGLALIRTFAASYVGTVWPSMATIWSPGLILPNAGAAGSFDVHAVAFGSSGRHLLTELIVSVSSAFRMSPVVAMMMNSNTIAMTKCTNDPAARTTRRCGAG